MCVWGGTCACHKAHVEGGGQPVDLVLSVHSTRVLCASICQLDKGNGQMAGARQWEDRDSAVNYSERDSQSFLELCRLVVII